jgi:glycosyltransferase involved in cell wall biosynthesis
MAVQRSVLMVAFYIPPFKGSSGLQRTLRFAQYLPDFGWSPLLLAPHERAYSNCASDFLAEIPAGVPVARAFALDAARHLAIRGAYLPWLALPDRFNTWLLGAVPAGLSLIRKHRPKAIWTTYPVATAHLIGYVLHKLSGLPWVADFRDPMLYEAWPEDPLLRRAHGWVERLAARNAARLVCVTPSAVELYRARYGKAGAEKVVMIPNGYDEASFTGIARAPGREGAPRKLVHSGLLEPADRDPTAFFEALHGLKADRRISHEQLQVVLRGSGFDERYRAQVESLGLSDIVTLEPMVPYRQALQEMVDADGLLLFQGPTCNRQIPAKAYEYIRAGTPILSICDPAGDTAALLARVPECSAPAFGNVQQIADAIMGFLSGRGVAAGLNGGQGVAAAYERKTLTRDLAGLLDGLS